MVSRRHFFALAGAGTAGAFLASPLRALHTRQDRGQSIRGTGYGSLRPDPNGLLDLPPGFQYRAFSRTGGIMSDGNPVPGDHDGMAAFAGPRGTTILVRNHELSPNEVDKPKVVAPASKQYDPLCRGGTTTLIVGPNRELIRDYATLAGTYRNCSGGATPWGSWISCEEDTSTPAGNQPDEPNNVSKMHGYNFEVPVRGRLVDPVPLMAMGRFNHEAIAVDPRTGIVYQTEDREDSLFYRFIPNQPGKLKAGDVLEALKIKNQPKAIFQSLRGIHTEPPLPLSIEYHIRVREMYSTQIGTAITKANFPVGKPMPVEWVRIEDVNPTEDTVRVEGFTKGAAQFTRGEGIAYGNGELYFCCTDGGELKLGQVWRYVPGKSAQEGGTIELFVEPNEQSAIDGPDNIVVSPFGDLIVCEDGDGEQCLVGVTSNGELYDFARNAINDREFAGACFSPDGRTMFVNIQDPGITFAIWGPWE